MKQARKIIFMILALLPILPLIAQVVSNIGNDNQTQISNYSWGNYFEYEDGEISLFPSEWLWDIYEEEQEDGTVIEWINADTGPGGSINSKILWGLYSGEQIQTNTFVGGIFKTIYKLNETLGIPMTPAWNYAVIYIIYLMFIEIIMLIVDITLLIPRKIKEWLN